MDARFSFSSRTTTVTTQFAALGLRRARIPYDPLGQLVVLLPLCLLPFLERHLGLALEKRQVHFVPLLVCSRFGLGRSWQFHYQRETPMVLFKDDRQICTCN